MNLANALTISRIVLAPICAGVLFFDIPGRELIAGIIFIIAALTDGIDGYVARVRREVTSFGKSFDPFADKVLILITLTALAITGRVPWVIFAIIALREVMITVLRHFAARKGLTVAASPWGKVKTFSQGVAIALILVEPSWNGALGNWVLWLAAALTVVSGLDYLWQWRSTFQKRIEG
jgi:CDP-diacylglycerol--glycerol-3-phosphate 3-phosphatidyltransferase